MTHTTTLSAAFGVSTAKPHALTLQAVCTESAVNAAKQTSTVTVALSIWNADDGVERAYTKTDGKIVVSVGGYQKQLSGKNVTFDVKGGHHTWTSPSKAAQHTITFTGVDNSYDSVEIDITGNWPSAPGDSAYATASGSLALSGDLMTTPKPPLSLDCESATDTTATITWESQATTVNPNAPYSNMSLHIQSSATSSTGPWSALAGWPISATDITNQSHTFAVTPGMHYKLALLVWNAVGSALSEYIEFDAPGTLPSGSTPSTGNDGTQPPLSPMGPSSSQFAAVASNTHYASLSVQTKSVVSPSMLAGQPIVPLRVSRWEMPASVMRDGWPSDPPQFNITSTLSIGVPSNPTTAGARPAPSAITTSATYRYLPASFTQSSGIWRPIGASDDTHSFQALAPANIPLLRPGGYTYALDENTKAADVIQFASDAGSWLFNSSIATAATIPELTILMVWAPSPQGIGGIWSNAPTNGSPPVPDLALPPGDIPYRTTTLAGSSVGVDSSDFASPAKVDISTTALVHKPCYLGITWSATMPTEVTVISAVDPSTPRIVQIGNQNQMMVQGALVLGADAADGFASGDFFCFEVGLYVGAMSQGQVVNEIAKLGQAYG